MINFKTITQKVQSIFDAGLNDYTITRNAERNADPNVAAKNKGWIGIYRDSIDYNPHTTGSTPWLANVNIRVELQVASFRSGEDAEDKLQDGEKEIMDLLNANKNIGGTVGMTMGYNIKYEYNVESQIYWHASIITLKTEVRI